MPCTGLLTDSCGDHCGVSHLYCITENKELEPLEKYFIFLYYKNLHYSVVKHDLNVAYFKPTEKL